jgi:hypothetical protein
MTISRRGLLQLLATETHGIHRNICQHPLSHRERARERE